MNSVILHHDFMYVSSHRLDQARCAVLPFVYRPRSTVTSVMQVLYVISGFATMTLGRDERTAELDLQGHFNNIPRSGRLDTLFFMLSLPLLFLCQAAR